MRCRGEVENDIHNVQVSLGRLQHEFTVLKFGRYLEEGPLTELSCAIAAVQDKLYELNAEKEMLR